MKLVKDVALLCRLYWGMDAPFRTVENFSDQLQFLLSNTSQREQEELEKKVEGLLQNTVNVLEVILSLFEAHLDAVKFELEEEILTPDEMWRNHDFRLTETYPRLTKTEFDVPEIEQWFKTLSKGHKILSLLDQIEELKQKILKYDNEIGELILSAWRKEHPYFSSMGTIDSDIQSDKLKDFKAFDRR